MPISLELVFDMTLYRDAGAHALQDHYASTLDMCGWADELGFETINLGEHHGTPTNYLSSPLVMAGAVAARTKNIQIRSIILTPFYNPIRLAEDLAVLSILSKGRAFAILAAGYRQAEFDMYGLRQEDRANNVEETIEVLRAAWSGESFSYRGRAIEIVSPVPDVRPRLIMGGATPLMARKAAKLNVGFAPANKPGLYELYRDELVKLGHSDPGPLPVDGPGFIYVSEEPEKDWEIVGPYALNGVQMYNGWMKGTVTKFNTRYPVVQGLEELKAAGSHKVVRPEECVELLRGIGADARLRWQVMPAGMPPELAWKSLRLFEQKVLPHLDVQTRTDTHY